MLEVFGQGPKLGRLHVPKGSRLAVLGPSASGKSALCLSLAGLDEDQRFAFDVAISGAPIHNLPPAERVNLMGYIPSDPVLAFSGIMPTLHLELQLACRMTSQPDVARERLVRLVQTLDLSTLLDRDPFTLSGGETARSAVGLVLLKAPRLLILDQVTDHLDPGALARLRGAIDEELPANAVVVETFSRAHHLETAIGRSIPLKPWGPWQVACVPRSGRAALPSPSQDMASQSATSANDAACWTSKPRLVAARLSYEYAGGGFVLPETDLDAKAGERIALVGPNGVGKTTLLKCLALLLEPTFAHFEMTSFDGTRTRPPKDGRKLHEWARSALYCFQRPEDQLYLRSVCEEIVDLAIRFGGADDASYALDVAGALGLQDLLEKSPFDLPRAHRRLIPIAAAIAARPPLLLLDEPTAGLDDEQVMRLREVLITQCHASAVIMISHDGGFVKEVATRVVSLTRTEPRTTVNPQSPLQRRDS